MSNTTESAEYSGNIAIVGMSCRFPGDGEGVDGFWQSISSGQCKLPHPRQRRVKHEKKERKRERSE
jgi:acyl transferase domain-containing protein